MADISTFQKNESEIASYAPIVRDLVRDGASTSNAGFFEIPIPTGCNRCEILCAVTGTAGDLLVYRSSQRERSASSVHVRALAATLAYSARGSRAVLELAPGAGVLQGAQTGLIGTMQAVAIFWRQP